MALACSSLALSRSMEIMSGTMRTMNVVEMVHEAFLVAVHHSLQNHFTSSPFMARVVLRVRAARLLFNAKLGDCGTLLLQAE